MSPVDIDPLTGAPIIKSSLPSNPSDPYSLPSTSDTPLTTGESPIESLDKKRSDTLTDEDIKNKIAELESKHQSGNALDSNLVSEPSKKDNLVNKSNDDLVNELNKMKPDSLINVMKTEESALTRVAKVRNILHDGGMDSQMVERSVPRLLELFTE